MLSSIHKSKIEEFMELIVNLSHDVWKSKKLENINQKTKNCVCNIPCECEPSYIGKTSRTLKNRVEEHKKICRQGERDKLTLAKHAWNTDHRIHWKKPIHHIQRKWANKNKAQRSSIYSRSSSSHQCTQPGTIRSLDAITAQVHTTQRTPPLLTDMNENGQ